jgi:hypothetical protein
MREQCSIDASICGSSVSERADGASGEIATTVSIMAHKANKREQGATGLLVEWRKPFKYENALKVCRDGA